jgi:hypothetical protein
MTTRRTVYAVILAPLFGLLLTLGLTPSANATTASATATGATTASTTVRPAASCYTDGETIYTKSLTETNRKVTVSLRYSPTCRTAWADDSGGWDDVQAAVYNDDTGKYAIANWPTWATPSINDAGTQSYACVTDLSNGEGVCTNSF